MKAILMSIRPEYGYRILHGEKTVELRKTEPIDREFLFHSDRTVYLYFSGTGMVLGEFRLKRVLRPSPDDYLKAMADAACLTPEELKTYGPGRDGCYHGWMTAEPGFYATPIPLSVFGVKHPPQSWRYVEAI